MNEILNAQLEVLEAVSDALEIIAVEGTVRLRDEVIAEANRRLREDGHPFEYFVLQDNLVFVRRAKGESV